MRTKASPELRSEISERIAAVTQYQDRVNLSRWQAGLARTHHDNRGEAGRRGIEFRVHERTSTSTMEGLVTMSYTAERFCDWATTASISSAVASASISNMTLMFW